MAFPATTRIVEAPWLPRDVAGRRVVTSRAQTVLEAVYSEWSKRRLLMITGPQALALVLLTEPAPVTNDLGDIVGLEVFVSAYQHGRQQPVDPHRIFVNPPLLVRSGSGWRYAPMAAFALSLVQSVITTPNERGAG
jgi:hypothetical protein